MIGIVLRALALLDQLAVSKPSMPRHLDVEQDARRSRRRSSSRSASSPDVRAHELLAERLEDRLEREQVLRPVVDEQDARPALPLSARRASARPPARTRAVRGSGPISSERERRASADASRAMRGVAASRGPRPSPGPATIATPPRSLDRARARRRRRRSRPVSTTPTTRSPYASAADSNRTSIDGRAELHAARRSRARSGPRSTSRW